MVYFVCGITTKINENVFLCTKKLVARPLKISFLKICIRAVFVPKPELWAQEVHIFKKNSAIIVHVGTHIVVKKLMHGVISVRNLLEVASFLFHPNALNRIPISAAIFPMPMRAEKDRSEFPFLRLKINCS